MRQSDDYAGKVLVTLSCCFGTYALALFLALPLYFSQSVRAADLSPSRGRDIFERRCTGCHSLDSEKEGPRLRSVYGRKSGTVPSFRYSDALKKADITWTDDSLDRWLTDPDKFVPENDMDFHLASPEERKAVIAYLKQLSEKQ